MKKIMIGTVALLAAAAVQAQSNVQLYGVVDAGIMVQNKDSKGGDGGTSFLDGGNSPSIWGLRGIEELGGGLKAAFQLEGGFSSANGGISNSNGGLFGRNATVELIGAFGSVRAGMQFSPFFRAIAASDARGMPQFGSTLQHHLDRFGSTALFDSNTVVYSTPDFNGLRGAVSYGFGEIAGSSSKGRKTSASVTYDQGPLFLNAAYYDANNTTTGASAARGKTIGAGYRVGIVAIKGALTNFKTPRTANGMGDIDLASAGAIVDLSPSVSLNGAMYYMKDKDVSANKSTMLTLGAEYIFSKRTALYAQLAAVDNKGAMHVNLGANAPADYGSPLGQTTTGLNLGIRHSF